MDNRINVLVPMASVATLGGGRALRTSGVGGISDISWEMTLWRSAITANSDCTRAAREPMTADQDRDTDIDADRDTDTEGVVGGDDGESAAGGIAFIVGAGPGDPGLITVRGRQLLDECDAIVYDALANPELLPVDRPGVAPPELFNVGKRGGLPGGSSQQTISELVVDLVRQGKRVVRLKGGDPFVFGRGGEEAQALHDASLAFEVVPGVPAGTGAAAYAGIPLTHHGLSTSVTLVAGPDDATDPVAVGARTDWSALAKAGGTIVLYASPKAIARVVDSLIAGGLPGEIPAAAIQWGTHPGQRIVTTTLDTLASEVASAGLSAPMVTVIGWTVVLRDELAWFEHRPLFGRRIVVTRAGDRVERGGLADRLRESGADVIDVPTTRIVALDSPALRTAFERLADYRWAAFTSANAVRVFWRALLAARRDARALAGVQLCAVGPATAAALFEHGLVVDVTAAKFAAEGILDAMRQRADVRGTRILYPCAETVRDVLPDGLAAMGAAVDRIAIYRSVPVERLAHALREHLDDRMADLVTFASASAVHAYVAAVGPEYAGRVPCASIGPVTTAAAREAGVPVAVEATNASLESLARAILRSFGGAL
jgi:uroporphyrinogen III methyltransferase/synthase